VKSKRWPKLGLCAKRAELLFTTCSKKVDDIYLRIEPEISIACFYASAGKNSITTIIIIVFYIYFLDSLQTGKKPVELNLRPFVFCKMLFTEKQVTLASPI